MERGNAIDKCIRNSIFVMLKLKTLEIEELEVPTVEIAYNRITFFQMVHDKTTCNLYFDITIPCHFLIKSTENEIKHKTVTLIFEHGF